ncbi:MAG: 30S ribosomal protein S8 [bacterium]
MSMSDPIGDMLVRIRNAGQANLRVVSMPYSKVKAEIARILKQEGFVGDFVVEAEGVKRSLRVFLKFRGGRSTIAGLRRVSRPGLRRYVGCTEIPRVLGGMGVAILSTPSGVLSDREARQRRLGGEILCSVW